MVLLPVFLVTPVSSYVLTSRLGVKKKRDGHAGMPVAENESERNVIIATAFKQKTLGG